MKQNKIKKHPFLNYPYFIVKRKRGHYFFILLSNVMNPRRLKKAFSI